MHCFKIVSSGNLRRTVQYTINLSNYDITDVADSLGIVFVEAFIDFSDQILHSSISESRVLFTSELKFYSTSHLTSLFHIHGNGTSYTFIDLKAMLVIERKLMILEHV
jgi:hypothetical protein